MTIKQFYKAVEIAREYGHADLRDGSILYFDGRYSWSVRDKNGNTVDVATDPKYLEYLFK